MTTQGFGGESFGLATFGSGATKAQKRQGKGLIINFASGYPQNKALGLSWSTQKPQQLALGLTFWTIPQITQFSINGTVVASPHHLVYNPRVALGYDQTGVSILQGSTSIEWQYDVMLDTDIALLMKLYSPVNPRVTITYPNELGYWVQKDAMMQPIQLGTRSTVIHSNISLVFTNIIPD